MSKIITLFLAAVGTIFFGSSIAEGESRGSRQGFSLHDSSSGIHITAGGGRHFDDRHFGGRFDHRHFDHRRFDRDDPHLKHDRDFILRDLDRHKYRRPPDDRRHFDSRFDDHRFRRDRDFFRDDSWKGDRHFRGRDHDRRFIPFYGGGITIYGDERVWNNHDAPGEAADDSRTTTYRGNEVAPDDPGSRTTTYRGGSGGGRTLGNMR